MRMGMVFVDEKRGFPFVKYIAVVLVIFILLFITITLKITPLIISVAKGYATNAVSNTLNDIIEDAMSTENYSFFDIINDSEGKVAAVTMNGADTNLLMTKISIGLKNAIADMDEIEASIPLGNFIPHPFFSGLGPDIPVKFLILANTSVNAHETFAAKGINQVLYTVAFHVVTDVGIYIPGMKSSVTVENDIPVAQTLIVGTVPDSYTNVEGMEGSVQDTVLDIE